MRRKWKRLGSEALRIQWPRDGERMARARSGRSQWAYLAVAAGALALLGCAASVDHDESTSETSSAILNGDVVAVDAIGTPNLSIKKGIHTSKCSSTRIGYRTLLTAHHCLTNEAVSSGGTPVVPSDVTATQLDGTTATGAHVYLHPLLDAAILTLTSDLPGGALAGIYSGSDAALVGKTLYCQGWGLNTFTSGWGTLRSANLSVLQTTLGGYVLGGNVQLGYEGDSGSGCFLPSGGTMAVTGVLSSYDDIASPDAPYGIPVNNIHVGAADIRDWIQSVLNSLPTVTSLSPARGGAGTVISIQGTNLTNAVISLDGTVIAGSSCSSTLCTFSAPADWGVKNVSLSVDGNPVAAGTFTYEPSPYCTYSFPDVPWDGECDGALAPFCPAAWNASPRGKPVGDPQGPDGGVLLESSAPVTIYKGASLNGPWTSFWNVAYTWTQVWPTVHEPDGSTIYLMACTYGKVCAPATPCPGGSAIGDCDPPVAVKVARYSCSTCTPIACTPGVMCGHASDGCGGFIECGSCASGSICQSNNWCSEPCTSPECLCAKSGGTWSTDSKVCVKCKTAACKCAAAGGSWTGHSCE
jgi:hypothetical protein